MAFLKRDEQFVEVPINDFPKFVGTSLVLVANTRKTIVRIAEISTPPSKDEEWGLVQANFPISDKMNENTHIFDGSVFKNESGEVRFFMTALPVLLCDEFTKTGMDITGSIHKIARLDTIEHILFRRYCDTNGSERNNWCRNTDESILIVLPQDDGLRLLHIAEGLPKAAAYISNHSDYREAEFSRLALTDVPQKTAIFITRENAPDLKWLEDLLTQKGFEITENMSKNFVI